jgi:SHS2 domain-containing protein
MSSWTHFEHGADIGVCGSGPTLAAAFEAAALALTAVITDPAAVRHDEPVAITCRAPTPEVLLVDWLNALVFEMAVRGMLFGRFAVTIDGDTLTAHAWGEAVDPARHTPAVEVKGATFSELHVGQDPSGRWTARCIVDV